MHSVRRALRLPCTVTFRGALLFAILVYLVTGPVIRQSDIVASVVAFSFLALAALLITVVYVRGRKLRREVKLTLSLDARGVRACSQQEAQLRYEFSGVSIPPLLKLHVVLELSDDVVHPVPLLLSGTFDADTAITQSITLPHRGVWFVQRAQAELRDMMGVLRFTWEIQEIEGRELFVYPPVPAETKLQIVTSTFREGDLVPVAHATLGDPYDMKRYHPGDGLKRIVWKIFARTSELYTRHPESTMSPEGQLVGFVVLGKYDDTFAGEVVAYVRHLEALGIEVSLGCIGADGEVARSAVELEQIMLRAVWRSPSTEEVVYELQKTIESFSTLHPRTILERIVLISSWRHLVEDPQQSVVSSLGQSITAAGKTPVVLTCNDNRNWSEHEQRTALGRLVSFFWGGAHQRERAYTDTAYTTVNETPSVLRAGADQGWEIHTS
jgi:hypothetical protein